ncbi:MAG: DUF2786 domain-containing protein [Synergistaceae bacterium]
MANNGRNGFEKYESDCDAVWLYRLRSSYSKIRKHVEEKTQKILREPTFHINPNTQYKWGSWEPSTRIMTFSAILLRNFEWEAVEHVMKHEVAHQIVSEIFDMNCYGVAHGAAWERACTIVGIKPVRCDSNKFLSEFKGNGGSSMADRVRKIIIHANDSAATEKEAETFMRKARELMLRHNIEMEDIMGTKRVWVSRPFGPNFERWPTYMWCLGNLLEEHFNIKHIKTYGPYNNCRLEIFGEPDNLDIAEYVGHALLNQAEKLYEIHKKGVAKEKALERISGSRYGYGRTRLSKRAFIEGIISGYSKKLRLDREEAEKRVGEQIAKERAEKEGSKYIAGDCAIVPAYDKRLMNEMYRNAYPRMRTTSSICVRGEGYLAGRNAGSKLSLAKGVSRGNNNGCLLAS